MIGSLEYRGLVLTEITTVIRELARIVYKKIPEVGEKKKEEVTQSN